MLTLNDVWVRIMSRDIVKGVTMEIKQYELHILMGPNGAGKSSLAHGIMGHRDYRLVRGKVFLDHEDITDLPTYEKVRKGLTIMHQNPPEIDGVKVYEVFNKISRKSVSKDVEKFLGMLRLGKDILSKELFKGISGGERKKLDLMRILIQEPKAVILDEPDSGVDIESIALIANAINYLISKGTAVLLITHQPRILKFLKPKKVYVMIDGRIVLEGGVELVKLIEIYGYNSLLRGAENG